ncbi:MAG TPA: YckD family protein [Firmicutes bacterium]|nr:YckD family protein [Bacillota bacterium]
MKKLLAFGIAALVLALTAIPALAATDTQDTTADLAALYQQMVNLRKQIIDKYVDLGRITPDQAKIAKDRVDQMYEWQKENNFQYGPGWGMAPGFCHSGFGPGAGLGRGPARWGYGPGYAPSSPAPAAQS